MVVLIGILLALFWRPLAISTFDEGFAASLGLPVTVISLGLVIASARLMTNRLGAQIAWSVAFALLSAILG